MDTKERFLKLPHPTHDSQVPLETALASRRSCRAFDRRIVPLQALSQLLWAGQGIDTQTRKRPAPSAKQHYPLTLHAVAHHVSKLSIDVYRYNPGNHSLSPTGLGDLRSTLQGYVLEDQPWLGEAPLMIAVSADIDGMDAAFAEQPPLGRGARYAYIEAGAVAQNIQLQACALEMGSVLAGAFDDGAVAEALMLPGGHLPVGLVCLGYPHG
ncbi:SagB/ThcOx family dehydrogenase [Marinobacter nanhaiticus D15-8W]|uniref:SagB/ThcOx family dehydrogenase n=1 Tax=Marinobacter nanhaiticus D15-8W TaxID=626887 RepID=N6W657_9GAMM|nr:SagB/ThcOx family dehydrogenase [Marinobacter nanhaiticus]ENO15689.1 SagB/ThcOx family dehydrogenase [Marinobacter nanhaiticus D15-8W]BES73459.1 SagB/ThcOx family dehydrogenase [Marinobacter nanhaiticus D15-8W]